MEIIIQNYTEIVYPNVKRKISKGKHPLNANKRARRKKNN